MGRELQNGHGQEGRCRGAAQLAGAAPWSGTRLKAGAMGSPARAKEGSAPCTGASVGAHARAELRRQQKVGAPDRTSCLHGLPCACRCTSCPSRTAARSGIRDTCSFGRRMTVGQASAGGAQNRPHANGRAHGATERCPGQPACPPPHPQRQAVLVARHRRLAGRPLQPEAALPHRHHAFAAARGPAGLALWHRCQALVAAQHLRAERRRHRADRVAS